jgi:hypothetical protein
MDFDPNQKSQYSSTMNRREVRSNLLLLPWLLTILLLPQLVGANISISGYIQRDKDRKFWMVLEPTRVAHKIRSDGPTHQHLDRLENGDFIYGHGTIDPLSQEIRIDNIDSVGLKNLLGHWVTWSGSNKIPQRRYFFSDFSKVAISSDDPNDSFPAKEIGEYRYTVAPSKENNEWTIFFANETSVAVGALRLSEVPLPQRLVRIITHTSKHEPPTTITLIPANSNGH